MSMQNYFGDLAAHLISGLKANEQLLVNISGEESDFCRLSGTRVRQAGKVRQARLSIRLIAGNGAEARHVDAALALSLAMTEDRRQAAALLGDLRSRLAELPPDPYLLFATSVASSESHRPSDLPPSTEIVAEILRAGAGLDVVGIFAGGRIFRGFANSLGQRNWYERASFNFDWSCYLRADKAVKSAYAGFTFDPKVLAAKMAAAKSQLTILGEKPRELTPGRYRAYLAPAALEEVTDMLGWGGFGLKALRSKDSPLLKLAEGQARLSPEVTATEDTAHGVAPNFDAYGFTKPDAVVLIDRGRYGASLVSPRSAKEYDQPTNGASSGEAPESLALAPGQLAAERAAAELGEGIYLNNLWYLNFSDRSAGRITGMTRFAAFWVTGGRITAPLNVMRFDDSVYRMFGDGLVGLTAEREMMLSSSTYGQRSTSSSTLPGALIADFQLTL